MSKPIQIYLSNHGTYNFTNGSYNNKKLTTQSVIMLGNENIGSFSAPSVNITLPLYNKLSTISSNNGNGTIFYLYNQQPSGGCTLIFNNPSGMEAFSLSLLPKERAVIGIMAQTYVVLSKMSNSTTYNTASSTTSSNTSSSTTSSNTSTGTVPNTNPGEPAGPPAFGF